MGDDDDDDAARRLLSAVDRAMVQRLDVARLRAGGWLEQRAGWRAACGGRGAAVFCCGHGQA
jgi:hypothetical protein